LSNGEAGYRYGSGKKPFGEYKVELGVRRNEVYEQYVVAPESGVRLSLKSVSPEGGPLAERLSAVGEPFSVGLLTLLDFKQNSSGGGDVLILTELAGTTLRERLAEGALGPERAFEYLRDLAGCLQTLEARGLPLPTVYPEAVCVRQDGARLDDYYLPLLYDTQRVPTCLSLAAYTAPEADEAGPGAKATLFSLGAVLYEMLVGRPPFTGSVRQVIAAIMTRDVDLAPAPEAARPLLQRLLARDPRERFASLAELAGLLGGAGGAFPAGDWSLPEAAGAEGAAAAPRDTGPRLEPLGPNAQGRPEFRRSLDGAVMVLAPGGTFTMGGASGGPAEQPPVAVTLEPFLIDKYPVTWEQFMAAHAGHDKSCEFCAARAQVVPSRYMPTPRKARDPHGLTDLEVRHPAVNDAISAEGGEKTPVVFLTWNEMRKYAETVGAELPSEAEWECACRAGTAARYPWGEEWDPDAAWFSGNAGGAPHPVGQKKPNPWGLCDMNGNVAEMCRDRFVKEIYEMVAGGAASAEELAAGVNRPTGRYSVRGGAFTSGENGVTSSFRAGAAPDLRSEARGFRCVIRKGHAPAWAEAAFAEAPPAVS